MMEILKKEAYKIMQNFPEFWASPFVSCLENIQKHQAINWVLECTSYYIHYQQSMYNTDWVEHLNPLKQHLHGISVMSIDKIREMSKYLFNSYEQRLNSQIILSKIYASEGAFLIENYENYERQLIDILWIINDYESSGDKNLSVFGCKCIELFGKYVIS